MTKYDVEQDQNGTTDLMQAAAEGNTALCRSLVAEGAKINQRNRFKQCALGMAFSGRHLDTVRFLIEAGADINRPLDNSGQTALHMAAYIGDIFLLNELLARGANIESRTRSGQTPLACTENEAAAKILLAAGARIDSVDKKGLTVLEQAIRSRKTAMVSLFRSISEQQVSVRVMAEAPAMHPEQFWYIIDQTRRSAKGDPVRQTKKLVILLTMLQLEEVFSFNKTMWDYFIACSTSRLWQAFFIINGGCSYDDFIIWRSWLIGQGKSVYEKAIDDPESLIEPVKSVRSYVDYTKKISSSIILDAPAEAYEIHSGGLRDFYQFVSHYQTDGVPEKLKSFDDSPEALREALPLLFDAFWPGVHYV